MHMCPTKRKPYYTWQQAQMVHEFMYNREDADYEELNKLRIYECEKCGYYHLGKPYERDR